MPKMPKKSNPLKEKVGKKNPLKEKVGKKNPLKEEVGKKNPLKEKVGKKNPLKEMLEKAEERRNPINRDPIGKDDERVLYAATTKIWDGLPWQDREKAVTDYFGVDTIKQAVEVARYDPLVGQMMQSLKESPASDAIDSPVETKAVKGHFTKKRFA